MKKTILLVVTGIVATIIINANLESTQIAAFSSSSPGGYTASKADNQTCNSCHSSVVGTKPNLITSNIPATGYVPGQTYTITATITEGTRKRYGFEIMAENSAKKSTGKIVISNAAETQRLTTARGESITHTNGGTSAPSGTKTWSFGWTAPAKGAGVVTFYGAFNASNSSGTDGGDLIFTSNTVVTEDISSGIAENEVTSFKAYPNPANTTLVVGENVSKITLTDLTGKTVATISANNGKASLADVESGIYLLSGYNGDVVVLSQKLVVEH